MLSLDRWAEILDTLRRNKLRTTLTGLAVAWGIFMLILLLAAGEGLHNNATHQFGGDAINSVWIRGGQTSMAHAGQKANRRIRFDNSDYETLRRELADAEHISGTFHIWGESLVSYGDKHTSFDVFAVYPGHRYLEKLEILSGRFINELDIRDARKSAVIGNRVRDYFFAGQDPLGKRIEYRGNSFTVVGVFSDPGGERDESRFYVPVTTAQRTFSSTDDLHALAFTIADGDAATGQRAAEKATAILAGRHDFSPSDPRAVRVHNNIEQFETFKQLFRWIRLFFWIVGIGTIVAGIVGVSNIMLISVAERTREFGVRKAIGATPWSIVSSVLHESILLTSIAGYLGLMAGVGVVELANKLFPENDYIRNPEVDIVVAVIATAILVVFGALAGFFPARRAARVNPVVALRDE